MVCRDAHILRLLPPPPPPTPPQALEKISCYKILLTTPIPLSSPPPPSVDKGGQEYASNAGRWRKRGVEGRVNERHHQKHLQVNQTSGTGAPSPAPHPIAPLAGPGQAFPRPVPCRFPRRSGKRQERRKGSRRAAVLEGLSYLEASGEESEDDLWFRRGGRRERGPQRGRVAGPGRAGGGPDSGREPGATAVRSGVPPVPRQRRL